MIVSGIEDVDEMTEVDESAVEWSEVCGSEWMDQEWLVVLLVASVVVVVAEKSEGR